jgi:hypothetical protein
LNVPVADDPGVGFGAGAGAVAVVRHLIWRHHLGVGVDVDRLMIWLMSGGMRSR